MELKDIDENHHFDFHLTPGAKSTNILQKIKHHVSESTRTFAETAERAQMNLFCTVDSAYRQQLPEYRRRID